MTELDRFRGCLLGLACGDAIGTTVEFQPRGSFTPLTDMVGGGPFNLQKGQWTDDTSMALCLAESLVECQRFDPRDQMERYCRWMNDGYLSSNGTCFDIGGTVENALYRFLDSGDAYSGSTDPQTAGNGCIMRLAPVPMYFFPDRDAAIHYSGLSAKTTHATPECVDASRLFGAMLIRALEGASKEEILQAHGVDNLSSAGLQLIACGDYLKKDENCIRGTGYVVDSLEAALWCFARTSTFEDAILCAANLGEDADTTAAVCGQIAGAYYGESGIPARWLDSLAMAGEIRGMAEELSVKQGFIDKDGLPNVLITINRSRRRKA